MPPRKRAESAPQPDPELPATPAEETSEEPQPVKRTRRTAPEPCPECFPGGWTEGSTAVGCEHGSWTRD